MDNSMYLLTEYEDLSCIFTPLKSTTRIKYTCFNTSNSYLIFGATSGSLYVFQREPCCFLQLLPNKEGSVTQVSISPDEKFIGFSTVKGMVCILEKTSNGIKHLITATEHQNEQVTCLQWNDVNNELFVGDNNGKVSIVLTSVFPAKGMFQTPCFVLMQLDSKIVQMDFNSNMLLVSTLTKCYICDTKKELFKQVGHKLRDGEYGACIFKTREENNSDSNNTTTTTDITNLSNLKLFCARPGSRVWECAIDGTVISTHHFKEALAVPPKKIYFLKDFKSSQNVNSSRDDEKHDVVQTNMNFTEQSFNFQKLYAFMSNKFLFTYKKDGLYIFDPEKSVLILWNNEITNIVDAKTVNDVIYVWSGFGKMYALNVVTLENLLISLYLSKNYLDLSKICVEHLNFLLKESGKSNKLHVLHDLNDKLSSPDNGYGDVLKPLIEIFKENARKKKLENVQRIKFEFYNATTQSDPHRHRHNNNNNQSDVNKFFFKNHKKPLRPSYLNLKGRSHSVSPERFQNGFQNIERGSTSSLPDLKDEQIKTKEEEGEEENSIKIDNNRSERCLIGKMEKFPVGNVENSIKKILESINDTTGNEEDSLKNTIQNFFDSFLDLARSNSNINNNNNNNNNNSLDSLDSLPFEKLINNDDDKNKISGFFHEKINSKFFYEWLENINGENFRSKERNEEGEEEIDKYPVFLVENIDKKCLEFDYKLSKILKLFSKILNEEKIVEIVKSMKLECYYKSLLEILNNYCEDCTSVSGNVNDDDMKSYPKLLNYIYSLINHVRMEEMSKYFDRVDINDFFYLVLKHEENITETGKFGKFVELQSNTIFLTYLNKILESDRGKFDREMNETIENYAINCLENFDSASSSVTDYNCTCGFPIYKFQSVYPIPIFPDLGHALILKNWKVKNEKKCFEMCRRIPYLWKLLIKVKRKDPFESVIKLIIQTGELEELETRSGDGNVDLNTLEKCLDLLIRVNEGYCLNCNEKIKSESGGEEGIVSWTKFGMISVKLSRNPEDALKLFGNKSKEILNSMKMDKNFYQSLIFCLIMGKHDNNNDKHKKKIIDKLLLSSSSSLSLSIDNDESDDGLSIASEKIGRKIFGENYRNSERDFSNHWGVKVNYKNVCTVCSLPLNTKVLIGESGLVVFKCCRRVFHSACLFKNDGGGGGGGGVDDDDDDLKCPNCGNDGKMKTSATTTTTTT
ncbi:conserved hypothetical protein [Pediculus humanus corporis]|uniref:Uncharacterized protein n=1 Tax=Pediculus humanus subsp. corporis TaxID=121224 RepID=E0VCT3_PEDHC|nr:uncharacterized protein Phum_PHUM097070 [Pediculus humanus corporis]EEB11189.1 conserved hypothetical protein [Pediculus humanus corporis]